MVKKHKGKNPKVRKNFRIPKYKVKGYVERFKELEDSYGVLTPEVVVHDAKKKSSPFHDYFEWNDGAAAHEYRLQQARYLIRSIEVTIIEGKSDQRAYVAVPIESVTGDEDDEGTGYACIETVLNSAYLRRQYIQRALKEAENYAKRYEGIAELDEIVATIKKVAAQFKRKKKKCKKKAKKKVAKRAASKKKKKRK